MAASDARAGTQDARPGGLRLFAQYAVASTRDMLFFAGLATKFTFVRVALGALAFGTFVFLAGLTRLITLQAH